MSIRCIVKFLASWTVTGIVGGATIGIIMGFGATGYLGFLGTVLIVVTAGAIFGFVGGCAFAPLFAWLGPQLPARPARAGVAAVLGTISGWLGIYAADRVVGTTHALGVGTVAGAVIGLIVGALSVSEYGHHKRPI